MTAGTVDDAEREIVLAEYRALRDEIGRIAGHRAMFRVVAFTLTSVAIGVGVERGSAVLLLLAPIAVLLGGHIVARQGVQIARVTDYIRDFVEPKLDRQATGSIGWHWFASERLRASRHLGDLMIVVVLTGVAVTLGWLAFPFFTGRALAIVTGVTVVDGALLVVFLSSYVRHRTAG
jgi:hypothetical protein